MKSAKREIGGVTLSITPCTGKFLLAIKPGVLIFSAESIKGINPAARNLRLPGQFKSFFDVKFLFSVIWT
jgi:hypothetical protein